MFLLCAVPANAPSDVAAYVDCVSDAVRVRWTLEVLKCSIIIHCLLLGCILYCSLAVEVVLSVSYLLVMYQK